MLSTSNKIFIIDKSVEVFSGGKELDLKEEKRSSSLVALSAGCDCSETRPVSGPRTYQIKDVARCLNLNMLMYIMLKSETVLVSRLYLEPCAAVRYVHHVWALGL